eukprot:Rmarinus@m.3294
MASGTIENPEEPKVDTECTFLTPRVYTSIPTELESLKLQGFSSLIARLGASCGRAKSEGLTTDRKRFRVQLPEKLPQSPVGVAEAKEVPHTDWTGSSGNVRVSHILVPSRAELSRLHTPAGTGSADVTVQVELRLRIERVRIALAKDPHTRTFEDTEDLRFILSLIPIFSGYSNAVLRQLARLCEREFIDEGNFVYAMGDEAHCMYFVMEGRLRLTRSPEIAEAATRFIHAGGHFGEEALLASSYWRVASTTTSPQSRPGSRLSTSGSSKDSRRNKKRRKGIESRESVEGPERNEFAITTDRTFLVVIPRFAFDQVIQTALNLQNTGTVSALCQLPCLQWMSSSDVAMISFLFSRERYLKGHVIVRQGEVGESVLFLAKGQCVAKLESRPSEGSELKATAVMQLCEGEALADWRLLKNPGPDPVSVVCMTDVTVFRANRSEFLLNIRNVVRAQFLTTARERLLSLLDRIDDLRVAPIKRRKDGYITVDETAIDPTILPPILRERHSPQIRKRVEDSVTYGMRPPDEEEFLVEVAGHRPPLPTPPKRESHKGLDNAMGFPKSLSDLGFSFRNVNSGVQLTDPAKLDTKTISTQLNFCGKVDPAVARQLARISRRKAKPGNETPRESQVEKDLYNKAEYTYTEQEPEPPPLGLDQLSVEQVLLRVEDSVLNSFTAFQGSLAGLQAANVWRQRVLRTFKRGRFAEMLLSQLRSPDSMLRRAILASHLEEINGGQYAVLSEELRQRYVQHRAEKTALANKPKEAISIPKESLKEEEKPAHIFAKRRRRATRMSLVESELMQDLEFGHVASRFLNWSWSGQGPSSPVFSSPQISATLPNYLKPSRLSLLGFESSLRRQSCGFVDANVGTGCVPLHLPGLPDTAMVLGDTEAVLTPPSFISGPLSPHDSAQSPTEKLGSSQPKLQRQKLHGARHRSVSSMGLGHSAGITETKTCTRMRSVSDLDNCGNGPGSGRNDVTQDVGRLLEQSRNHQPTERSILGRRITEFESSPRNNVGGTKTLIHEDTDDRDKNHRNPTSIVNSNRNEPQSELVTPSPTLSAIGAAKRYAWSYVKRRSSARRWGRSSKASVPSPNLNMAIDTVEDVRELLQAQLQELQSELHDYKTILDDELDGNENPRKSWLLDNGSLLSFGQSFHGTSLSQELVSTTIVEKDESRRASAQSGDGNNTEASEIRSQNVLEGSDNNISLGNSPLQNFRESSPSPVGREPEETKEKDTGKQNLNSHRSSNCSSRSSIDVARLQTEGDEVIHMTGLDDVNFVSSQSKMEFSEEQIQGTSLSGRSLTEKGANAFESVSSARTADLLAAGDVLSSNDEVIKEGVDCTSRVKNASASPNNADRAAQEISFLKDGESVDTSSSQASKSNCRAPLDDNLSQLVRAQTVPARSPRLDSWPGTPLAPLSNTLNLNSDGSVGPVGGLRHRGGAMDSATPEEVLPKKSVENKGKNHVLQMDVEIQGKDEGERGLCPQDEDGVMIAPSVCRSLPVRSRVQPLLLHSVTLDGSISEEIEGRERAVGMPMSPVRKVAEAAMKTGAMERRHSVKPKPQQSSRKPFKVLSQKGALWRDFSDCAAVGANVDEEHPAHQHALDSYIEKARKLLHARPGPPSYRQLSSPSGPAESLKPRFTFSGRPVSTSATAPPRPVSTTPTIRSKSDAVRSDSVVVLGVSAPTPVPLDDFQIATRMQSSFLPRSPASPSATSKELRASTVLATSPAASKPKVDTFHAEEMRPTKLEASRTLGSRLESCSPHPSVSRTTPLPLPQSRWVHTIPTPISSPTQVPTLSPSVQTNYNTSSAQFSKDSTGPVFCQTRADTTNISTLEANLPVRVIRPTVSKSVNPPPSCEPISVGERLPIATYPKKRLQLTGKKKQERTLPSKTSTLSTGTAPLGVRWNLQAVENMNSPPIYGRQEDRLNYHASPCNGYDNSSSLKRKPMQSTLQERIREAEWHKLTRTDGSPVPGPGARLGFREGRPRMGRATAMRVRDTIPRRGTPPKDLKGLACSLQLRRTSDSDPVTVFKLPV